MLWLICTNFIDIFGKNIILRDLATAFLQLTTSRTTFKKVQSAKRAFYFLQLYKKCREKSHPCETYYNIGRAYAHFSMFGNAIKYFEKSINIWAQRNLSRSNAGETQNLTTDAVFKECVYNLMIIHKKMGNNAHASQLVTNFLWIYDF